MSERSRSRSPPRSPARDGGAASKNEGGSNPGTNMFEFPPTTLPPFLHSQLVSITWISLNPPNTPSNTSAFSARLAFLTPFSATSTGCRSNALSALTCSKSSSLLTAT
jgi:hypothetical protein